MGKFRRPGLNRKDAAAYQYQVSQCTYMCSWKKLSKTLYPLTYAFSTFLSSKLDLIGQRISYPFASHIGYAKPFGSPLDLPRTLRVSQQEENLPSGHKSVDLIWEPFDNVLHLQILLVRIDVLLLLALRWQESNRYGNIRCIVRVDHCRMHGSCGLEGRAGGGAEVDNLSSPAKANNAPSLDLGVDGLDFAKDLWDPAYGLGRCSSGREEIAKLLALFLVFRWIPRDVGRVAFEPVRHKYLILAVLVGMGKDVGTLQSLIPEAEDIEDIQDTVSGAGGTSLV